MAKEKSGGRPGPPGASWGLLLSLRSGSDLRKRKPEIIEFFSLSTRSSVQKKASAGVLLLWPGKWSEILWVELARRGVGGAAIRGRGMRDSGVGVFAVFRDGRGWRARGGDADAGLREALARVLGANERWEQSGP